jgi:DNA mismatch repair ATPase MutS
LTLPLLLTAATATDCYCFLLPLLTVTADAMDVDTVEDSSEEVDAPPAAVCAYGVCLVDAATATFKLGQFEDTAARPRLRTLLAQSPPAEVSIL